MSPTSPPARPASEAAALDRRLLLIGGGLLLTAGGAAAMTPRRFERQLGRQKVDELLPSAFGPWRERPRGDVIVPEDSQPTSVYDQVAIRTFMQEGAPDIALLIAYGSAQSGLMKVHRPEVCYASAGFKILGAHDADVALTPRAHVPARAFEGVRDARREQVLYWTRVGEGFPTSMNGERWASFRAGLRGVIPDGVLVRFSTIADDPQAGERLLAGAARDLVASASVPARRLLTGSLLSA